jgi:hypothetical protein
MWYCTLQLGIYNFSLQNCLSSFYCTLHLGIYNLFPSTLSVEVVLHITAGNLQLIRFNTVCSGDTAHWSWGSKTYYIKHCLWLWHCTVQLWIYNLFPSTLHLVVILHMTSWDLQLIHSTLSVVVILHITAGDLQLIPFNTVFGDDTDITAGDLQLIPFITLCGSDTAHHSCR